MEHQNEELEIDLVEFFYYLRKKIWIIVAAFLVCSVLGFVITQFFVAPEYTASTRMYVLNRSNENAINSSDYSISNYMVSDYEVLITGKNVTKKVIEQLGLDMTTAELSQKISVSAIENTRVLQITVVDTDAQQAADIANWVREIASQQIRSIMDVDAVNLVFEAEAPQEKSGPSLVKNTILAAGIGVVVVVGILTVFFIMDDSICTEDDVERYLGLGVLGVIPSCTELATAPVKKTNKLKHVLRINARQKK